MTEGERRGFALPRNTHAQKRKRERKTTSVSGGGGKGTCSSQAQGEGATHVLRRGGGELETKETED